MAFVSTLGKVSAAKSASPRFPRIRLSGLEGAAVRRATPVMRRRLSGLEDLAALAVATRRTPVRSLRLGDMGKAAPGKVSVFRSTRLRGMGDSCAIDPATGGRVCTTPASTQPAIVPMLPQPIPGGSYGLTCKNISINGGVLAAQCDAGGGAYYPTTLPNASQCIASGGDIQNINGTLKCQMPTAVAPVPTPATTIPAVIDPATGIPFSQEYPANLLNPATGYPYSYTGPTTTIQPSYPYSSPSSFVSTSPAYAAASSGGYDWKTIGIGAGVLIVGGIILKKMLK